MTDATETPQHRPRWRALAARLAVVSVVVAATGIAALALHQRAGAGTVAEVAAPMPVAALSLERVPGYAETRRYAGRIEPARAATLGFERGGRVTEVLVEEGDAVAAGDVLARLDIRLLENARVRLEATRKAQVASVELARLTDARQAGLTDRAVSAQRRDEARLQLAEAEARLAETDAALEGIAIDLEKSEVRAPFAGRVAARMLDEGTVVATGGPVVELLETTAPRARIGLAPEVAAELEVGGRYTVDYRGIARPARLVTLRPDIDPANRTVEAIFDLAVADGLVFGDLVRFDATVWKSHPGYWVPLSALVEDRSALWSLYTIAEADGENAGAPARVRSRSVEVVSVTGESAFVSGDLPEGAAIVHDGTHRVIPGQAIRVAGRGG